MERLSTILRRKEVQATMEILDKEPEETTLDLKIKAEKVVQEQEQRTKPVESQDAGLVRKKSINLLQNRLKRSQSSPAEIPAELRNKSLPSSPIEYHAADRSVVDLVKAPDTGTVDTGTADIAKEEDTDCAKTADCPSAGSLDSSDMNWESWEQLERTQKPPTPEKLESEMQLLEQSLKRLERAATVKISTAVKPASPLIASPRTHSLYNRQKTTRKRHSKLKIPSRTTSKDTDQRNIQCFATAFSNSKQYQLALFNDVLVVCKIISGKYQVKNVFKLNEISITKNQVLNPRVNYLVTVNSQSLDDIDDLIHNFVHHLHRLDPETVGSMLSSNSTALKKYISYFPTTRPFEEAFDHFYSVYKDSVLNFGHVLLDTFITCYSEANGSHFHTLKQIALDKLATLKENSKFLGKFKKVLKLQQEKPVDNSEFEVSVASASTHSVDLVLTLKTSILKPLNVQILANQCIVLPDSIQFGAPCNHKISVKLDDNSPKVLFFVSDIDIKPLVLDPAEILYEFSFETRTLGLSMPLVKTKTFILKNQAEIEQWQAGCAALGLECRLPSNPGSQRLLTREELLLNWA